MKYGVRKHDSYTAEALMTWSVSGQFCSFNLLLVYNIDMSIYSNLLTNRTMKKRSYLHFYSILQFEETVLENDHSDIH